MSEERFTAAEEFAATWRPGDPWHCTRDHVLAPCGDCDGCRYSATAARPVPNEEKRAPHGGTT